MLALLFCISRYEFVEKGCALLNYVLPIDIVGVDLLDALIILACLGPVCLLALLSCCSLILAVTVVNWTLVVEAKKRL